MILDQAKQKQTSEYQTPSKLMFKSSKKNMILLFCSQNKGIPITKGQCKKLQMGFINRIVDNHKIAILQTTQITEMEYI